MERLSPDKTSTKELLVLGPVPLHGSEGGYGHWPCSYIRVVSRIDCRPDESESLIANDMVFLQAFLIANDMVFLQVIRYSYTTKSLCYAVFPLCCGEQGGGLASFPGPRRSGNEARGGRAHRLCTAVTAVTTGQNFDCYFARLDC